MSLVKLLLVQLVNALAGSREDLRQKRARLGDVCLEMRAHSKIHTNPYPLKPHVTSHPSMSFVTVSATTSFKYSSVVQLVMRSMDAATALNN
jgi:hypothetical protein